MSEFEYEEKDEEELPDDVADIHQWARTIAGTIVLVALFWLEPDIIVSATVGAAISLYHLSRLTDAARRLLSVADDLTPQAGGAAAIFGAAIRLAVTMAALGLLFISGYFSGLALTAGISATPIAIFAWFLTEGRGKNDSNDVDKRHHDLKVKA